MLSKRQDCLGWKMPERVRIIRRPTTTLLLTFSGNRFSILAKSQARLTSFRYGVLWTTIAIPDLREQRRRRSGSPTTKPTNATLCLCAETAPKNDSLGCGQYPQTGKDIAHALSHGDQAVPLASRRNFDALGHKREHEPAGMK